MDTRREFLKKAALLSGSAGVYRALPVSIQKALAINPQIGSTYLDAEHVVILMQENRSFDHCFGTLQGVRGFNDPRAIDLPNDNKVWLQTNAAGDTYLPFRLNIKDSKATWLGSLPHSWTNQVDARNHGKHDKWLDAKRSGHKEYADLPLTMGYYNREDIPFYYALADAFTVCDQNFCSSLTGTTPNRLFLWTGTIRETHDDTSHANVRNEEVDYGAEARWKTFPERLEENGISWNVYQNEISLASLSGEEDDWLANFTDNPLEWFTQYQVRYSTGYHKFIEKQLPLLPDEIAALEKYIASLSSPSKELDNAKKNLGRKQKLLQVLREDQKNWSKENYNKLSQHEKNIHDKAFSTNINDPHYHKLTTLKYNDDTVARELQVPKGDVLHQFRDDVKTGKLPQVSWIVAPSNFSDHPGSPWYGAWYVSEVMDILTQNEEVWKKTIFILAYDENDGYFDHVPPYVVPNPYQDGTGMVSKEIDTRVDYVTMEQELKRKPAHECRENSIGLGYRVPLLIASPWSRGGTVNSEIFDHTSILQFLENFLNHKSGKKVEEDNISNWRRTICGDLSSVFIPYKGEKIKTPDFLKKDYVIESIHKAKFKGVPSGFKKLGKDEIESANKSTYAFPLMPRQEKGIRSSSALPYQLYAEGKLGADKKTFEIKFEARDHFFGKRAAGSPFNVYARKFADKTKQSVHPDVRTWNYAVAAGDSLQDTWLLDNFEYENYHLSVNGPNGFLREFKGSANDPLLDISCGYHLRNNKPDGNIELRVINLSGHQSYKIEIKDHSYKTNNISKTVGPSGKGSLVIDLSGSHHWYHFSILVAGAASFEKRYAGRVETGATGFTDPFMGQVV
jgi:phospholipase C